MNDYKARVIVEYNQLRDRCNKLRAMLDKDRDGTLGFTLSCPRDMLARQLQAMTQYRSVLEERAQVEHITLD